MSNNYGVPGYNVAYGTGDENGANAPVEPRRLELSLNPEDGSLLTAPLMSVLLAATDGLYSDLYNMIQGEIDVTTTTVPHADEGANADQNEDENAVVPITGAQIRRERMSNLSFAQRRHELAWRLAANGRSLQHVAALCAAAASSDLAGSTAVSSRALQHTRTAWVQADEAQDALFFFHAQLFPGRAAPHDVYGAADVVCTGKWYDLPRDLLLTVDRYETSAESTWSRIETDKRWQLAVRDKLIMGEVGWLRRKLLQQQQQQLQKSIDEKETWGMLGEVEVKDPLWKVSLSGGIVKLTHGKPKFLQDLIGHNENHHSQQSTASQSNNSPKKKKYPIEALLSVFPNPKSDFSEWTLLSIDVHVQAKTGEFNHQLETSNRQRYDLHRLAALAMGREEARTRRLKQELSEESEKEKQGKTDDDVVMSENEKKPTAIDPSSIEREESEIPPARPLHCLFQVVHTFALSWQLELLSAQAQALRRGVWAAAAGNLIQVTPVKFFDNNSKVLGVVSISFWKVDDSYGPPSMGDITLEEENSKPVVDEGTSVASSLAINTANRHYGSSTNQLVLSIRAEADLGIRVSMSGAASIIDDILSGESDSQNQDRLRRQQLRSTVAELLEHASNPFSLSASDSLLAATKLCAELKCQAVVEALQPIQKGTANRKSVIPPWMRLAVDRGSIAVAARIEYFGVSSSAEELVEDMPILFHLMCDARTGSFVNAFPRSMHVLRKLAGQSVYQASEPMALRVASLPQNRRRAAGAQSSHRMVRDAFDSLIRSMNLLGQRAGVGGSWDNIDDKSSSLRDRAILTSCLDAKSALIKCCGMTALYGLAPLAVGTAVGLDATPDLAGDTLLSLDGKDMLAAPPIGILLDQEVIETSQHTSDGVNKKLTHMEQSIFSITCAVDENALTLFPVDIAVKLDSISALPQRKSCSMMKFVQPATSSSDDLSGDTGDPPAKRKKLFDDRDAATSSTQMVDILDEVGRFAEILSQTLEAELDEDVPRIS